MAAKVGSTIVGYCIGAHGAPCGRPLASARHYQRLKVYEHRGGGRCRSCAMKILRRKQLLEPTDVTPVDLSWQAGAACAGQDSGLFTRDLNGNKIPDETEAAAWKFCHGCPIKARCSSEADRHLDIGLRGGVYRILRPRVKAGEPNRYKRYDVLAGESPYKPPASKAAA